MVMIAGNRCFIGHPVVGQDGISSHLEHPVVGQDGILSHLDKSEAMDWV
jgi:hypothetical protein